MLIPFFSFRIMVGCGLMMLGLAWIGSYLSFKRTPGAATAAAVADFPQLPAALHRDADRLVHGRSRASAVDGLWRPPDRRRRHAIPDDAWRRRSLVIVFGAVYTFIFLFGTFYIYRLQRTGPPGICSSPPL